MKRLSRLGKALLEVFYAYPVGGLAAVFLAGMMFWGAFNWSLELANTEAFCISCHSMKQYIYTEYRKTIHHQNRTGVRASCPDCHVPREWIHKVVRKVGATNELFHWLNGSIDTPEKFEAKREELARGVWASMEATDSRECRNCHGTGTMSAEAQTASARTWHALADKWRTTCIECHQGIVHSLPRGFDKEARMDKLHDRMEREKVNCRLCHEGIVAPPPGEGWGR